MEIRCSLCGRTQDEVEYTVSVNGSPTLISFCHTCFEPPSDHVKRSREVRSHCPHGQPIRSSRRDARHLKSCPDCQKEYYSPLTVARRRAQGYVHPRRR